MKVSVKAMACGLLAVFTLGCVPPPKSGKGFTLPVGDMAKGKEAYIALNCNACHIIDGIEQNIVGDAKPTHSIKLGGEVNRIQTYGELVTSVINPSHRLAKGYPKEDIAIDGVSMMKNYNDVMTVTQLVDLVAFLQSKYKLIEIEPTYYTVYSVH